MTERKNTGAPGTWPAISLAEAASLLTASGSHFEIAEEYVHGRKASVWKHAPRDLRTLLLDAWKDHAEKTFLVYRAERITYDAFGKAVLKLADELARAGVGKGDRVTIIMRNLPEFPVAAFAAAVLGAIVAPLNAWGTGLNLLAGISDSDPTVIVADEDRWKRVLESLPEAPAVLENVREVIVTRQGSDREQPLSCGTKLRDWNDVVGAPDTWSALPRFAVPAVEIAPDDVASLFYTSGTTGSSKGVMQTHRNAGSTLMVGTYAVARNMLRAGLPVPSRKVENKANLLSVPLFHTTGFHLYLLRAMSTGSKLVMIHKWDPLEAMQLIESEQITTFGGVPTLAWDVVNHPRRKEFDLSSVEVLTYGGAPSSPVLFERIKDAFKPTVPATGWGMTETTAAFTQLSGRELQDHPGSAGLCAPVGAMSIRDESSNPLPAGQIGELWVTGPNCAIGYWRRPAETAEVFIDGWVRTGDLGYLDENGFLYLVDRKKDMIIRGGENIFCAEVESALYHHPSVADVVVIARSHETLGEEPVALIALKEGASADVSEIAGAARKHIAAFKIPADIIFVSEPLPRNPSGKLDKALAKKLYQKLSRA